MKKTLLIAISLLLSHSAYSKTFTITLTKDSFSLPKSPIPQIVSINGARQWSDGSYSNSCLNYLNPPSGKKYQGDTGNGIYRIKTNDGIVEEVNCDMTGGGWTQVFGSNMPQVVLKINYRNYSGTVTNSKDSISLNDNVACDGTPHQIGLNSQGIPHTQIKFENTQWIGYGANQSTSDYCVGNGTTSYDGPEINQQYVLSGQTITKQYGASFAFSQQAATTLSNVNLSCTCASPNGQRGTLSSGQIWIK